MHDYMKAMKRQFCPETESRHRSEAERLHHLLSQRLSRPNRRLLLHLVDEQGMLLEVETLTAFTAGFKLAVGLAKELSLEELYSFDQDEEQHAVAACAASKTAPHKTIKPVGQKRGE